MHAPATTPIAQHGQTIPREYEQREMQQLQQRAQDNLADIEIPGLDPAELEAEPERSAADIHLMRAMDIVLIAGAMVLIAAVLKVMSSS